MEKAAFYYNNFKKVLEQGEQYTFTERDKGTFFEELTKKYLSVDAYSNQYSKVQSYSDWANEQGISARDDGIDLVATVNTVADKPVEYHAIQCKNYRQGSTINKADIDSFLAASGKNYFSHRIIAETTQTTWSKPAESEIADQQIPVTKISYADFVNSSIDWSKFDYEQQQTPLKPKNQLRDHQTKAVTSVINAMTSTDRGKMIMACGTGKTFTSLKIAEQQCGNGKTVLFLVPSLALLQQTFSEWSQQSVAALTCFAVCSDSHIGKKHSSIDDVTMQQHELAYPATTNAKTLAKKLAAQHSYQAMTVVFGTYHSLQVIADAQAKHQLPEFDLIICDEAHRTTGATFEDKQESNFVIVHNNDKIKAKKRLYMTATPKIYNDSDKIKAKQEDIAICSMDDAKVYGDTLYTLNFSTAVSLGLLVDYKVIVLTIDEMHIDKRLQQYFKNSDGSQLNVDDAAKIIGCWKALSKVDKDGAKLQQQGIDDKPMQRAVAYCQVIEAAKPGKNQVHKVSSKQIADQFDAVVSEYIKTEPEANLLQCQAQHVDGTMNASEKTNKIDWLKADIAPDNCRILCNVRCLSEGVDVPALDAVLFLSPRQSQVEVVQTVGRVMRQSADKKLGYIILPVVIPADISPDKALDNNKTYKIVWDVLQALRAHDDRFDSYVNKLDLLNDPSGRMEVIPVSDLESQERRANNKASKDKSKKQAAAVIAPGNSIGVTPEMEQITFDFAVTSLERGLYAKLVQKCGNRMYWDEWASDIAKIAQTHIARISNIVSQDNPKEYQIFSDFVAELRKNINDQISETEVIEMLAQHLITEPVFQALFSDYDFAEHNPISKAMQKVLDQLQQHNLNKEAATLQGFYNSVKLRAEGIDNAEGKQKIVIELYDKFFRNAFPKMTERLGIVYTPVECVDFIIHSVNDILKQEFNQTLADDNTHIIDPFTGTGTFISRLLQSGLIPQKRLQHKFSKELHANEIVLLAYYIASINIETSYYDLINYGVSNDKDKQPYRAFEGICLTDSFQLYEDDKDIFTPHLPYNSKRLNRQKHLKDIRVIIGNPPYSAGQKSGNDNNQNLKYSKLDASIERSYAVNSKAANKNSLYDSYIRAIRWASDRLGNRGVIGFITNGGWLDSNAMDGMRKTLAEEFSSIYVFHLRGNQRTSGELSRKEGGKIFGSGSRAPIAISILVKNPNDAIIGKIYYHDIGDYLTREQKLEKIAKIKSIANLPKPVMIKLSADIVKEEARLQHKYDIAENKLVWVSPNKYHDWLNKRDDSYYSHIAIGDKKSKGKTIFANYSRGIGTSRDAWVYNSSKNLLQANIKQTINFYNSELVRYQQSDKTIELNDFVKYELKKISWNSKLLNGLNRNINNTFEASKLTKSIYRPFNETNLYFDDLLVYELANNNQIFPEAGLDNLVIAVSGKGSNSFSCLISDKLVDLHLLESQSQCFPLKLYQSMVDDDSNKGAMLFPEVDIDQEAESAQADSGNDYLKTDAITDAGLHHFSNYYKQQFSKQDLFYYIYGLLHSPDYRAKYASNLSKDLPHIPRVKTYSDFQKFAQAGRDLADLHLNYEKKSAYAATINKTQTVADLAKFPDSQFTVRKMKLKSKDDKTTIVYNDHITISNIPPEAYNYIVNGKSAIDWIIDRQQIRTHKDSQIPNNPNHWATETMQNPRYPLELLLKIITISTDSVKIINNLPKLDI